MINDILEAKLQTIGLVPGVSLFRNYMPVDCTIGAMTRVPLQGIPIDPYIPDFYKGRLQLIIRHKEPDLGAQLASQAQRVLTIAGRELHPATAERGAVHLDIFTPETLPISFPRLNGNGYEWSQHFTCAFGMKSAA
jgi:hypothetical protein